MYIFYKQLLRRTGFTVFLVLLLVLAVGFSCVGFTAWRSVKRQAEGLNGQYTTIAVQKDLTEVDSQIVNAKDPEKVAEALLNVVYADRAAAEAPQLVQIDRRCLLSAYVEGCKALSSCSLDPLQYNADLEKECFNLAVFALRCTNMEVDGSGSLYYEGEFEVEGIVSLLDAYDVFPLPTALCISSELCTEDGKLPFEEGKTYLVLGAYEDYPIKEYYDMTTDEDGHIYQGDELKTGQLPEENGGRRYLRPLPIASAKFETVYVDGGTEGPGYCCPAEGQLPWYAEYTGTWEDFLNSEEGTIWREEILPLCSLNYCTLTTVLTDQMQSIYIFNTGEASLLEGRFFSGTEYMTGAPVCIISAAYADYNGLQLGDTLRLDYYNSGYNSFLNGASSVSVFSGADPGPYISRQICLPEERIGVEKEYTIVGIYTAPTFSFGSHLFPTDTVFIPKASVPGAEEYESPASSLMNSFVLENGSEDAFEAYMAEQGYANMFLYFDQSFDAASVSLDALEANALRLFAVSIAVFLLAALLFSYLSFRRMAPTAYSMRLLGVSPKTVRREMLAAYLGLMLLSIAVGIGAGVILYRTLAERIFSVYFAPQLQFIMVCGVFHIFLLLLTGVIGARVTTKRQLMYTEGGKRGRRS